MFTRSGFIDSGKLPGAALLLLWWLSPQADELHVAAAANFSKPLQKLAAAFEQQSGHRTVISIGSTGKLYAQIMHGAPYEVFLAADSRRPAMLETHGKAVAGSRFTYAVGRLALWSRESDYVPATGMPDSAGFTRLAIANPRLAPYGEAARDTLRKLGVWDDVQSKIVRGESISQTFQFVASGNARLGFIARSQLPREQGSAWLVPEHLHQPIAQQAVILKNTKAAQAFVLFLQQADAQQLIQQGGYSLAKTRHAERR